MKSTFGELRPIFYASREVKQRERKKAKGLHMQNNNFARASFVFVQLLTTTTWITQGDSTQFFGGVPPYFETLWYSHLYFYRKSNT